MKEKKQRFRAPVLCLGFLLSGAGCDEARTGGYVRPPTKDEIPASVKVSGGAMTVGFTLGTIRAPAQVEKFAISKTPITVGRYRQCMAAGACDEPVLEIAACEQASPTMTQGNAFKVPGGEELPATCLGASQAKAYCEWIGGELPTVEQWMLAARGPEVQRFAWGSSWPTCEEHPRAGVDGTQNHCCKEGCDRKFYAVGQGEGVKSASGMADALATPAELLKSSPSAPYEACKGAGRSKCAVYGLVPGAIDVVMSIKEGLGALPTPVYGFRCVTKKEVTP